MWSIRTSFERFVSRFAYFIVMLTITSQGANAQYNYRNFFYSATPNVQRNYWRQVGNQYGIKAYPPSAIQFSYSGDFKTVGDYCYTKSLIGVCTLTSKCSEVVRDIQNGKNPVVCSYQASEAVVCCPKWKYQSNQPVWSNNNNQGSSTNKIIGPIKFTHLNNPNNFETPTPYNHLHHIQLKLLKLLKITKLVKKSFQFVIRTYDGVNKNVKNIRDWEPMLVSSYHCQF